MARRAKHPRPILSKRTAPGRLTCGRGFLVAVRTKKSPAVGEGSTSTFRQLPPIVLFVAVLSTLPSGFLILTVRVVLILLVLPLTATAALLYSTLLPALVLLARIILVVLSHSSTPFYMRSRTIAEVC